MLLKRLSYLSLSLLLVPLFANAQAVQNTDTVDLLWQGEVYTPPFYLGRALWSNQTRATIVAVPHISGANPATLIYKWSQNDTVLGSASGAGQRTLAFNDSVLSGSTQISVDVLSPDGASVLGSASVSLTPVQAETLVVEDNPLYGLLLNNAVDQSFTLKGQEASFVALPLFSNALSRTSAAETYSWISSGANTYSGNKVTYRIPEGSAGSSQVTVRAENKTTLIQPEDKTFLIQFDKQNDF